MRRSVWIIAGAALLLGVVVGGCGKSLEDYRAPSRGRGKADAPMALDQLKQFAKPYVLVGQYTACDETCINTEQASGGIKGASARCCTPFAPTALMAQSFGGACPAGMNAVSTQAGGTACQVLAGGHTIYMPKDCSPFDDAATIAEVCGSAGQCDQYGYCSYTGGAGREQINYQNRAKNLHPELTTSSAHHKFNDALTECNSNTQSDLCGAGVDDVFASQWWPQSKNGIAWRWVPGATQPLDNYSDPKTLSPVEKYDFMFSNLSTSCNAADQINVNGRTFCPKKVSCGSNRCEKKAASGGGYESVACHSADAEYCVNFSWSDLQDSDTNCRQGNGNNNNDQYGGCSPVRNKLVKVIGPATKWELENHGTFQNVQPDSWWGHCNGWASYATAEALKYPKEDICVKLVGGEITRCTSDAAAVQQCGTGDTAGCTLFRMGDIEALMSEIYFADSATFTGKRCNVRPDDIEHDEMGRPKQDECRDINAGTFHVAVTGMLGTGVTPFLGGDKTKLSFIIDHNWDHQVWNFPLVKFQFDKVTKIAADGSNCKPALPTAEAAEAAGDTELAEMLRSNTPRDQICAARMVSLASNGDYSKLNPHATTKQYAMVTMRYWMVSDGVSAYKMMKRADQRGVEAHEHQMNYILELDAQGKIMGGEWTKDPTYSWGDDSKEAHPDFLWAAIKPAGQGGEDDLGDSDNKFMNYLKIKALLKCANDASTCSDDTPPPPPPGGGTETLLELSSQSVARRATAEHSVTVPANTSKLEITMTPTEGDPDLILPCNNPYKIGLEAETCVQENLAAGSLKITVFGYQQSTYNIKVVATVSGGNPPPPPPPADNICKDHCGGGEVTGSAGSCFCDVECITYGDCCKDATGAHTSDRSVYVTANNRCPVGP